MIQQFQKTKYVHEPKMPCSSVAKGPPSPELPEPPPGQVTYQVLCRNKDFLISPRLIEIEGTAGLKSVPLCLSVAGVSPGWHAADIVLSCPKFSDVITARVAVLVSKSSPA
ncbi:uncharacterized protein LOC119101149 [Pollicipes pollicipes]|uniref:uncharacterized protein LOC119101149 n=1 Tax=Pollicipes pollicipes TaxID=41117 RepID=UPI00188510F7|nr:uncharacterized protein LOC119101149 [Pollicipes pollicipes]